MKTDYSSNTPVASVAGSSLQSQKKFRPSVHMRIEDPAVPGLLATYAQGKAQLEREWSEQEDDRTQEEEQSVTAKPEPWKPHWIIL